MPIDILMPALSPTMEKGNLAKWLKKEGDAIKAGDIIAEIETDKATMEVEAVDEGILAKIIVPEGSQDVPVNQLIAVIAGEGEDVKAAAGGAGASKPAAAAPAAAAPAPAKAEPAPVAAAAPPPAPASIAQAASGIRLFASPLAKRIAKLEGIDLSKVAGTGPHGRIVERDVKSALAGGTAKAAPAPAAAAAPSAPKPAPVAGPSDEQVKKLFEPGSFEEIPHDNMRKVIARRLTEAKSTIPHFYLTLDCELDALLALREQINKGAPLTDGKPAYKLSVNDMIIKALAMALARRSGCQCHLDRWRDAQAQARRYRRRRVDPRRPHYPVVRDACHKPLSVISNEMKDLAARARNRKLKPEEYQGGSSAVSNLGMFGIKDFAAVINPPHATILAVGAGEKRIVVKNDAPAVATVMSVTLSTDHRAVDGALGAELLSAFKGYVENPISMLV